MLHKLKKIDNIYYCVLSSSTTEQEVKMAEGFMRLLPLSGFPGVTSPYRHLLVKSWHHHAKQLFTFILSLLPPPRRLCVYLRFSKISRKVYERISMKFSLNADNGPRNIKFW